MIGPLMKIVSLLSFPSLIVALNLDLEPPGEHSHQNFEKLLMQHHFRDFHQNQPPQTMQMQLQMQSSPTSPQNSHQNPEIEHSPFYPHHHHHQQSQQPEQSKPHYGPPRLQKTVKHVSIFVAPPPVKSHSEIFEKPQENHLNIIFIKNPQYEDKSNSEQEKKRKTVVYVLNENKQKQSEEKQEQFDKPEVYFVRYNNKNNEQGHKPYGPPPEFSHFPGKDESSQDYNFASTSQNLHEFTSFYDFDREERSPETSSEIPFKENTFNPSDFSANKIYSAATSSSSTSTEINKTYAPTMAYNNNNYGVNKREINNSSKNDSFRPYLYAQRMGHSYYGIY